MFIISCKYDGEEHPNHDPSRAIRKKSPIRECVKSIVELHPNEKVALKDIFDPIVWFIDCATILASWNFVKTVSVALVGELDFLNNNSIW